MRVGIGYDIHRLAEGRPLILGGVSIDYPVGLDGHSDADVLTHAIIDALLGAAKLGDIGALFPDTDVAWKGADSLELLKTVVQRVADAGWRVGNVDATIVMQRPKLRGFIADMESNLAQVMHVSADDVAVKATTGEKLGFVGREEGVAAHAVCLLLKHA